MGVSYQQRHYRRTRIVHLVNGNTMDEYRFSKSQANLLTKIYNTKAFGDLCLTSEERRILNLSFIKTEILFSSLSEQEYDYAIRYTESEKKILNTIRIKWLKFTNANK